MLVGTSATNVTSTVGRARLIIQNLGPGTVFFKPGPGVTTTDGLEIDSKDVYEFPIPVLMSTGYSLIASQVNTDVRVLTVPEG